jgi:L-asparaginase / beta-aspartyl-peptidase
MTSDQAARQPLLRGPLRVAMTGLAVTLLVSGCGTASSDGVAPREASSPQGEPGPKMQWGLVIHGGAGTISRETMTPGMEAVYRASLEAALRAGHQVLAAGGQALDAVVAAVQVMEDDSLFNAGRGAVFTNDGRHELDAAIMDGPTLRAGAVAGVTTVRSPIALARTVMEQSEHVFMAGRGAEAFAQAHGMETVPQSYYRTEARWEALQRARAAEERTEQPPAGQGGGRGGEGSGIRTSSPNAHRFGTVGAVALDQRGRLAAATSTGGMTNKRWGRIGDVPVIGAGTYANPTCGVSGTGWGEVFIMNTVARDICARMEFGNLTLQAAAHQVMQEILPAQAEDTGGVIALSADGQVVWSFNTPGMYRGRMDQDGAVTVGIYGDES